MHKETPVFNSSAPMHLQTYFFCCYYFGTIFHLYLLQVMGKLYCKKGVPTHALKKLQTLHRKSKDPLTNAHAYHIYVHNDAFEEYEMLTKYKVKLDKDGRGIYDMNICIETSQTDGHMQKCLPIFTLPLAPNRHCSMNVILKVCWRPF